MSDVLAQSGRDLVRRRSGPCPSCGCERTGKQRQLPVVVSRQYGWFCVKCGTEGDSIEFAALHLGLSVPVRGQDYKSVLAWLATGETSPRAEAVDEPLVRINPWPALNRARHIARVEDPVLLSWLEQRAIPRTAPAAWLPSFEAAWWPRGYARWFPLVVPVCTGTGEVVSMQGRAVLPNAPTKTRWPSGAAARELLFATPAARRALAGWENPEYLLIVEGLTDFLTQASIMPTVPVVGVTEGAAAALRTTRLCATTKILIGTHVDGKGVKYERDVADAMPMRIIRKAPLERLGRVA